MCSKVGFVCQLESKGSEYGLQVAAILEIARTKKDTPRRPSAKTRSEMV